MKETRFIELVNLYIDRQITAAETAELEAEIQQNPRARAIYRQYCRMHAATKQVYENFRAHADQPAAAQPAGRGTVARFSHRKRSRSLLWVNLAGGLAAAACLAVLFVRYNSAPPTIAAPVAKIETAPATPVVTTPPATAVAAAPTATSARPSLMVEPDYAAMLAALRREEQRAVASGQLPAGRLPSLFDDGVFDAPPFQSNVNQRVFRGKHTPQQQAEFTAFEFRH